MNESQFLVGLLFPDREPGIEVWRVQETPAQCVLVRAWILGRDGGRSTREEPPGST